MSLLDDINAEIIVRGGSCVTGRIVTAIRSDNPKLAAELDAAMTDLDNTPGSAIAKALSKRGYKISGEALQRHRRGGCKCG